MRALAAIGLIAALGLSGCAGYRNFNDGKAAMNEGRMADGVALLRQAAEEAPGNTEYRRTYITQRDGATTRLIRQAELDRDNNDFERARAAYDEVLAMQPDHARATAGINELEVAERHARTLDVAALQAERGEHDGAISKVRQVLSENAVHRRANTLLKRLMRQQADVSGKELGIYPKLKATYRTPVSLSFTGASLRQVFESLKLASGLNYLFDKDVNANNQVTMSFTDKPVEDVLRLILAINQLDFRVLDGDTLLIYPSTAAKAADYREMVVRSFYLTNADVNKTSALIKGIAKAKDVFVDERLNLLIVRDSAEVVRLAEKLIAAADMPEPEVMLELEVMEVNVNRLKQIGIQWPDSVSSSIVGRRGVAGQVDLNELNFPLPRSMFRLNIGDPLVSARLRAQNGDSNLLANPRVRVRNRQSAKILIGDKVPVITVTNTANVGTSESVSYLDVGLKLEIEPNISLDDEVSMKLSLEVSNIVDTITRSTGTQTYRLGTRNTSTVLRVKDGETNVLAGLIQKEDRRSNTGVPYLNELPLVSKLFGAAEDSDTKTEIILLITPRIIRNLELPGVGLQEFGAGTENAVGAQPIQLGSSPVKNTPPAGLNAPSAIQPALTGTQVRPPPATAPTPLAPLPAQAPASTLNPLPESVSPPSATEPPPPVMRPMRRRPPPIFEEEGAPPPSPTPQGGLPTPPPR
jgi:general secretion pathway protein D